MTLDGRAEFTRQLPHVVVVAVVALSLAACTDGYPTEDVPQIDPARMKQAPLLAALNALGKEPHLALETRRWSDTVRARSLLTHLEVRCGSPLPPTA